MAGRESERGAEARLFPAVAPVRPGEHVRGARRPASRSTVKKYEQCCKVLAIIVHGLTPCSDSCPHMGNGVECADASLLVCHVERCAGACGETWCELASELAQDRKSVV